MIKKSRLFIMITILLLIIINCVSSCHSKNNIFLSQSNISLDYYYIQEPILPYDNLKIPLNMTYSITPGLFGRFLLKIYKN